MALGTAPQRQRRRQPVISPPGLFGTRPRNRLRLVIAVLLALLSLGPLVYMVMLSFQSNNDIQGNTVLLPTHPTTNNYVVAWTENSFGHYFTGLVGGFCLRPL
jgi:ABC-type glycerol-3-phosphate transport system permease component